jgi:thioester reductase-like protein
MSYLHHWDYKYIYKIMKKNKTRQEILESYGDRIRAIQGDKAEMMKIFEEIKQEFIKNEIDVTGKED